MHVWLIGNKSGGDAVVSLIFKTRERERESRICLVGGIQTAERKMRSEFWFAENELRSLRAEKERDCVWRQNVRRHVK